MPARCTIYEVFAKAGELAALTFPAPPDAGDGDLHRPVRGAIWASPRSSRCMSGCRIPWKGLTPISALIHAATMVTAGIFMVARMSPLFEPEDTALNFVLVIGAITALFMGFPCSSRTTSNGWLRTHPVPARVHDGGVGVSAHWWRCST